MKDTKLEHITNEQIIGLDSRKRVNLINSLSGIKSCNLIATINEEGVENLAIISSVFHLGASPALLGFVIRPDTVPRDTLSNIRTTKLCTLNNVCSSYFKEAHQTSARYLESVSEFEQAGLSPIYHDSIAVPFVAESSIRAGLKFVREIPIVENSTHILICEITDIFHGAQAIFEDGTLDIQKAGSIGVSGLNTYYDIKRIARLAYAKPDKSPTEI